MTVDQLAVELSQFQTAGGTLRTAPAEDTNLVLTAQEGLGLSFSPDYISFHQRYSYLQIGAYEFESIGLLSDLYQELWVAKQLPARHLFPVLASHSGGYYYLAYRGPTSSRNADCGRILHYEGFGKHSELSKSYPDFFAFMMTLIEKSSAFLEG